MQAMPYQPHKHFRIMKKKIVQVLSKCASENIYNESLIKRYSDAVKRLSIQNGINVSTFRLPWLVQQEPVNFKATHHFSSRQMKKGVLAPQQSAFSKLGSSDVEVVAVVHRFLFIPLERTSIDYFCPFSGNLQGKGFCYVNEDIQRMRTLRSSSGALCSSLLTVIIQIQTYIQLH